jgi:2-polyprenyl-3-methyl-5-hydroxy-6-metoxy-1,4-benzoquinol methylase
MFDESYFSSGNYAELKTGRTSMYFWARRFYANLVLRYRRGGRLLEIGSGLGHLLARLQDHFDAYGTDISEFGIEQAAKVATKANLRVLPAERLGEFDREFFDVIVGLHVVEHLQDPLTALHTCYSILRPGGMLLIATPNLKAPLKRLKGQEWHGYKDPTHISLKEPDEWKRLLRAAGFEVKHAFGDGLWNVPYVKYVPAPLQLAFFGWPAAIQTLLARPLIPVGLSESLIVIAEKPH